jgi:hypothetical protein
MDRTSRSGWSRTYRLPCLGLRQLLGEFAVAARVNVRNVSRSSSCSLKSLSASETAVLLFPVPGRR